VKSAESCSTTSAAGSVFIKSSLTFKGGMDFIPAAAQSRRFIFIWTFE